MAAGSPRARHEGFTYLGALFLITVMGLGLAGTAETWTVASRRERERELLWAGNQYARALKSYRDQSPGPRQFPGRLEDLLEDRRFPQPRAHLRQLYLDPITRGPWGTVPDAQGRIAAVRSLSDETPMKQANFPAKWLAFQGTTHYSDWQFAADPAPAAPPPAALGTLTSPTSPTAPTARP